MKNPNNQIIITTIFILLLMCVYAVSGAQACVDCDLNKDAFNGKAEVMEIEWHNPDGTVPVSYTHLTLPTKRIV